MRVGQYSEGLLRLQLTSNLVIQCSSCGRVCIVSSDELDERSFQEECQMGLEITHELYGERKCIECGALLQFNLVLSEYPVGAYSYHTHMSAGCEFVFEPSMQLECQTLDWLSPLAEDEAKASIDETMAIIEDAKSGLQPFDDMTPWEFEEFVSEVFRRSGYRVELTQKTRDGGKDIIASCSAGGVPYLLIIECKHFGETHPVSVSIVREAYGVMEDFGASKCAIVTTSRYSPEARKFAERHAHRIQLVGIEDLIRMAESWRDDV